MKRGVSDELFSNAARILLVCSLIQCPELRLNSSKTPLALRIQVSAVFGIKLTGRERAVGCFDHLLQAGWSVDDLATLSTCRPLNCRVPSYHWK